MRKLLIIIASVMSVLMMASSVLAAAPYTAEVTQGVNFRDKPSTSGNIHRMLKRGEEITILEEVNAYWLKVRTKDGKAGYISSDGKYTKQIETTVYETTILYGVNFRSEASTSSGRVYRMLSKGETVHVLSRLTPQWLKIQTRDGTVGYVSANSKYTDYKGEPTGNTGAVNRSGIVSAAKSHIGKYTYQFGGEPWNSNNRYIDCSAFVQLIFGERQIDLPRVSRDQAKAGAFVSRSNLQEGDLVFFDTDEDGIVNHVGIYIGDNSFVHASPIFTNGAVGTTQLSGWWSDHYVTGRDVM